MANLKKRGFTLVELLTVVAIIALLIGILVPAVNQARKIAVRTSVRAQISGISSGIEMFKTDFGYYPSSVPQSTTGVDAKADRSDAESGNLIEGAHRLAFALLGRDQQGCPAKRGGKVFGSGASAENPGPDSIKGWYYTSDGSFSGSTNSDSSDIYFPGDTNWGDVVYKTARKGPYIDPKGFGIVNDTTLGTGADQYVFLLTDKYDKQAQNDIADPEDYAQHSAILYYAANERGRYLQRDSEAATDNTTNRIYYWQDNRRILTSDNSPLFNGGYDAQNFFNYIEDEKATVGPTHRPYNPESFLLISRGYDGIYGTDDDVTNWGD